MALTGTDRGAGTNNTSALTFTFSPASNFTAGAMAVLCVACDNNDSSGAAHSTFTVTDTLGNTWTRRSSPIYDPGAAAAGVEGAIFTTPMNGGTLTTGTVITVTFDAANTAECWTLMEVVGSVGTPTFKAQGVGTGSATASPTVTTSSRPSGQMVIGAIFNEHGTAQTPTGDSDTTNGSWSTMQTAEIGTTAAGITIISQRKVVTATGTQTYNPTLGVSSDVIAAWIAIGEDVSVSPGTGAITYTGIAPTASSTSNTFASPGTGEIVYTGIAPTAFSSDNQSAEPGTGAIAYTGQAPTVSITENQVAAPGTGQIAYDGQAPTIDITEHQFAAPGTGQISITGIAPTVVITDHQVADPGTGQIVFSGEVPVVNITNNTYAFPETGEIVITGHRPVILTGALGNFSIFSHKTIRGSQNGIR